jgi:hypothetical protein
MLEDDRHVAFDRVCVADIVRQLDAVKRCGIVEANVQVRRASSVSSIGLIGSRSSK